MKLLLKNRNSSYSAVCDYDLKTKKTKILKGSTVSKNVSNSDQFRSRNTIIKTRQKYVVDGVVMDDVIFNSLSSAANFITGTSTNGFLAWKNNEGESYRSLQGEK